MKDYVFFNQPAVKKLLDFIQAGGPEETEYDEMTRLWDSLLVDAAPTGADGQNRRKLLDLFGEDFLQQTIQGFSYRKPYGYAGDFQIIDFFYQQKIIAEARFQKWDKYVHSLHAARAVRNRKDYFIRLVKERANRSSQPIRVLNIASGPCRDVLELFREVLPEKVKVHCVDLDPNAIQYAKNLLGNYADAVQFTRANIFKFNTTERFDLIWSAGLFDYFNDEDFVKVLSKVFSWCAPNGELVIGNFSVENPTRSYMEKAYNWWLFHRTQDQLKQLAARVSSKADNVEVKSEPLQINLFLHMRPFGE